MIDIDPVDLANGCGADADRYGALADLSRQADTGGRGQPFRVVHTRDRADVGRHHDGTCDNGARERTPSNFVYAGDERPDCFAKLALDAGPAIPALGAAPHVWLLGRAGLWNRDAHLLLLDAGRLAREMTKVIELRTTDAPAPHDVDVRQHRAVRRENALHAHAVGDFANRECLADARTAAGNAHALERLNSLFFALFHAHVHTQRITRPERRNVPQPLF